MLSSGGLSFTSIGNTLGQITTAREAELQRNIAGLDASARPEDLLNLQVSMQQWSMFTQLQSTIVKELGDALKGVVQKAA